MPQAEFHDPGGRVSDGRQYTSQSASQQPSANTDPQTTKNMSKFRKPYFSR
jgi:hypothetical protein